MDHSDFHRGPHDRDPDEFTYSEEGSRRSDGSLSGLGRELGVPHTMSESSGVLSPVPTVYRQGSPAHGSRSRMFEQFASPQVPASVTRLDLHEGMEDGR